MKRTAILISTFSLLLIPSPAFAEVNVQVSNSEGSSQVNVNSESTGTSTICQNGKCTTTGGESTSTVCINGKCTTTNEDVNYQSEDGSTKVEVNNSGAKVEVSPIITNKENPTPTLSEPTITQNPEVEKKIAKVEEKVEEMQSQVKQRMKDKDSMIGAFIQSEIASLQNLIATLFN